MNKMKSIMEQFKKETYFSPEARVFEVKAEGVICNSISSELSTAINPMGDPETLE